MENEFRRLITPIPDDNTCEAITFGSAYKFAKSSKFFWDGLDHMIRSDIEELKRQLIDREFCAYVLNSPGLRSMIYRKSPPVSEPDKIKDLWTLRRISNLYSGLIHLDAIRKQNVMWSSMTGTREYTTKMMETGISESQWKIAADGMDMPIEFETLRAIIERDEEESYREVEKITRDMESHRLECQQFERDLENYRRLCHAETEEEALPDIRILKEVESGEDPECTDAAMPEPKPSPIYRLIGTAISEWLYDDMERFADMLQTAPTEA